MNFRLRELSGVRAAADEPTPEALAIIGGPDFAGRPVTAEDVHVRRMWLCHDQYDRAGERFPKAYLERFAETAPGKAMLPGHDTSALPIGRFFDAEVRARTQQFPVLVRARKAADPIPGFEPAQKKVTWLAPSFYFPNDASTEAQRKAIDTGLYRDVSIGFTYDDLACDVCKASYFGDCPHWIGQWTEDGTLVTGTYAGDAAKAEMREGSIVYLGCQPMAALAKGMAERGEVDPKRLALTPFGEDLATLKWAEAQARLYGHDCKAYAFPALVAPPAQESGPADAGAAGETSMTPEEKAAFEAATKRADDEAAKAKDAAEKLAAASAEAAAEKKRADGLAETLGKAFSAIQAEWLDDIHKLEEDETMAADIAARLVELGDWEGLKTRADAARKRVLEKFPTGTQGDPGAGVEEGGAERPVRPRDHALV